MKRIDKLIRADTKVLDEAKGEVEAVVSTETKDRDGDIIRVAGWDIVNFLSHPILLSSHNYGDIRAQIGEWSSMEVKGKKLVGVANYYVGEGNEEADWAFNLAKKGRAAFSVGFIPDMDKAEEIKDSPGFFSSYEFNGQELLEVSHVTVPSNPRALQTMKSFNLNPVIAQMVDEVLKDTPAESPIEGADVEALAKRMYELIQADFKAMLAEVTGIIEEHQAFTTPQTGDLFSDAFKELKEEQV